MITDNGDRSAFVREDELAEEHSSTSSSLQNSGDHLTEQSPIVSSQTAVQILMEGSSKDRQNRRQLMIIYGFLAAISVLSAVALGIGFAAGDKQVKPSGQVASDCAMCADLGLAILKKGGSAVDATITTVLCNGVVNLHSSGMGGGGVMFIHDVRSDVSMAIDFHAVAPGLASGDLYSEDTFLEFGGLAVAVPGEVAGLYLAHKHFGKLPWSDLVEPVIEIASGGFGLTDESYNAFSERGLIQETHSTGSKLWNLLMDSTGQRKLAGTLIQRPDYARALALIASDPLGSFYSGDIAKDIVASAQNHTVRGVLAIDDLRQYRAQLCDVINVTFNGSIIKTVGPPAAGAVVLQVLSVLKGYLQNTTEFTSDLAYHRLAEAFKFGFASFGDLYDEEIYEKRQNLTASVLSADKCNNITSRLSDQKTHDIPYYGASFLNDVSPDSLDGGSAVTSIDNDDLIVSCVTSLNKVFGSAVMTETYGIILNNDMKNFDRPFNSSNRSAVKPNPNNFIRPNRRPRSTMAPTVFLNRQKKCDLRGSVAAAGGYTSITAVVQTLLDLLVYGKNADESQKKGRIHHSLLPNILFLEDSVEADVERSLKMKGHQTSRDRKLGVVSIGLKDKMIPNGASDGRTKGKFIII